MHSLRFWWKLLRSPEWTTFTKNACLLQQKSNTESVCGFFSFGYHSSASASCKATIPSCRDPKTLLDEATQPQPEEVDFPSDVREGGRPDYSTKRSQRKHAFRPKIDPKETTIFLFPGQGSQFVGMGKGLLDTPGTEELYSTASTILGYDLLDLCLNGPSDKLNQTVYCQPAVFVTSIAAIQKLKQSCPWAIEHCITAAGFSVGEYAALVFSGSLNFEDAIRVIRVRAEAMHEASLVTPSGMLTVFLTHKTKLKYACHTAKRYCTEVLNIENAVCEVANYLYPECKVVAGNNEALDFLEKHGKEFGILRTQRLPVSGAFHTNLMKPACQQLKEVIRDTDIRTPVIPVHSNVNGFKYRHPQTIERMLIRQLSEPVKWEQTMHILYSRPEGEDFPFTYEVGPGSQLGRILLRTNRKAYSQYEAVPV